MPESPALVVDVALLAFARRYANTPIKRDILILYGENPHLGDDVAGIARRLGLIEDWKAELQKLVNQIRANDIAPGRIADFAAANAGDLLAHLPKPCKNDLTAELRQAIGAAWPEIERGAAAKGRPNIALPD